MQKVLTAMGMPEINKKLKNTNLFDVYETDVQYREGIIDILKDNNNFDILIIFEKLPGEINFENLIKEIKIINDKINIIFILENKNENLEKILFNQNIKNIFYNEKINFEDFIFKLKKLEINQEEFLKKEINNLNKIILEKNNELLKYKKNNKDEKNNKLIIIANLKTDEFKLIKNNIFNNLENKINYFNFNNLNKKIKYSEKIILLAESDFESLKKLNKNIKKIEDKYLINKNKINLLFIECSENKISFKLIKNIFKNNLILGKIKFKKEKIIFNKKIIKKIIQEN